MNLTKKTACKTCHITNKRRLSGIEIPATWHRTPKQEFQKSAGGDAGTGAGKNGGAVRSAGACAGSLFSVFLKGPACQHLSQHSGQHPHFYQHPRHHFSGIPVLGSCARSPGSQFWYFLEMHLNSLKHDMFKPFRSHSGLLG